MTKVLSAFGRCIEESPEADSDREAEPNRVDLAFLLLRLRRGDPSLTMLDLSFCLHSDIESLLASADSDSESESDSNRHLAVGGIPEADGAGPSFRHKRGMQALADAISCSPVVQLRMVSCRMGPSEVCSLGTGIGRSAVLTSINLSFNRLGKEGARALAQALAASRSLTTVILKSCHMGPSEVAALSPGIRNNALLGVLDLSFNSIEEAGAMHLGAVLQNGPKRKTPLELIGVDLAPVAAKMGLGKSESGWTTRTIIAALNESCTTGVEVSREETQET
jgi:hypothetical protein